MRRSVVWATALTLFVGLVLGGGAVWAISDGEINAAVQFNFSVPGARSLGLGGAFLAVADDATAAFTNPAGLTILSKPEISLEAKYWDITTEYTNEGHGFGPATGTGIDTIEGLQLGEADSSTAGASFVSFVWPGKKWAAAAYRHELANFETDFQTQGAFFDVGGGNVRFFPVMAEMDIDIVNWGVSGAYRISQNFSIGAGASIYEFEIDSTTQRFDVTQLGQFFAPPDFDPGNIVSVQTQTGTDTDVGFNLGLQWKFLPKWNLAFVYRLGPEFEYDSANNGVIVNSTTTFAVPDVAGLGVAFRPTDAMLISFDYNFVEYSALTEEVTSNFVPQSALSQAELDSLARIKTEDGSEVHLGFEYVFLGGTPVAVRIGSWFDPDHKMTFDGDPLVLDNIDDRANAGLFFEGDDEVHVSAGVGVVIGKSFQIDAAVDVSTLVNTVSLSGVYRF